MIKEYKIVVVSDSYGNFAGHCIHEAIKRGYGNGDRKIVSYTARFSGEPDLLFQWANHKDPTVLSHVSRMEFDEIHIAGPEIDEEMVDIFEVLRADIRNRKGGIAKVVLSERTNKKV